jgi:hypothetical protein
MLREALRHTMAEVTPPPPMSCPAMVRAARQARERRLFRCAGTGTVVLVAAVVATVAVLPRAVPVPMAGLGAAGSPAALMTPTAGPRYDQAVRALDALLTAVPAGYVVPDLPESRIKFARPARSVHGIEVWEYQAVIDVTRGGASGGLVVDIHTPGNDMPEDMCLAAAQLQSPPSNCEQLVDIRGIKVATTARTSEGPASLSQWAGYRHPDGTVVIAAQMRKIRDDRAALPTLPLTSEELVTLACDDGFDLN